MGIGLLHHILRATLFRTDCRNKLRHRHCEPTGRANARPMTGSAKQSISPRKERMDCFVASLLAMTADTTSRPRGAMRPSCAFNFRPIEGVGNAGCPLHPQPRARSPVGWVERSDTHHLRQLQLMGIASLHPSYALR